MKNGDTVRYTAEELRRMRARGEDRTDWARIDAKTDPEIAADTATDPAWEGIPEDWADRASPTLMAEILEGGGRKRPVTIRLDADIVDYFKAQGRGWQTRINAALRAYVESRTR